MAHSDLDTVFSLFPVIQVINPDSCTKQFNNFIMYHSLYAHTLCLQEKDTILVESYARIKHLQTRTWLHLDKGITLLVPAQKRLITSLVALPLPLSPSLEMTLRYIIGLKIGIFGTYISSLELIMNYQSVTQ